ncbi:SMI1/KNR4 family protein [Actinomadura xylanilytica]|uniref:SMI1/KNR4 family protein n=1 Tax=Actinomadura xylanilytica TaxID=887459 RepID=UPI00255AAFCA|nr:SMI1/KNR4 family protein [Actinomadura xylanilytica]MDL4773162.1 SMI1/KNR4 family protein [Actinomadura xylanilytica]
MTRRRDITHAQLLEHLARKVAEAAPEGWRRGRVRASGSGTGSAVHAAWYDRPNGSTTGMDVDIVGDPNWTFYFGEVAPGRLDLDLVVEPSGRFEAFTSPAAERPVSGPDRLLLVLEPGNLPAEPGDEQEGPADPTFAGDPDEAVRLFREYLRLRAGILGREHDLHPPLDAAVRARLPRENGAALPSDLMALYGEADGESDEGMLLGNQTWFALEHTLDRSRVWSPTLTWTGDPWWRVADSVPRGAVRQSVHRDGWVRFATNTGGDFLAVDLDPGPSGRPGQVVHISKGYGAVYVADSVTTLLRRHVEALERGDYTLRTHDPDLEALEDLDPEDIDLDVLNRYLDEEDLEREDLDLYLHIDIGLPREGGAPGRDAMRHVTLTGDAHDLAALCDTSVEALRLVSDHPVDLDVLRTLPRLQGLDLSRADVRGIETLAELNGVLYLCLRYEQWQDLWQGAKEPSFAAIALGGDPSPHEAHAWVLRFGAAAEHHVGDLNP